VSIENSSIRVPKTTLKISALQSDSRSQNSSILTNEVKLPKSNDLTKSLFLDLKKFKLEYKSFKDTKGN